MIVEGEKDLIPEPSGQEEDPRLSKKTGGGKTKFSYLDFDNVNTEKSSATTESSKTSEEILASTVDEENGKFLCPHGEKDKNLCKECQGADEKGVDNSKTICKHGKLKYRCHPCGGRGVCEHGKRKTHCKTCGGSVFCPHGRQKSTCRECGGSAVCIHGRQKRQCKDCGGAGLCPHLRQKPNCKDCGGSAICPHGRRKYNCKECTLGVSVETKSSTTIKSETICRDGLVKADCKCWYCVIVRNNL